MTAFHKKNLVYLCLLALCLILAACSSQSEEGWTRLNAADKTVPITPPPGAVLESPSLEAAEPDPLEPVLLACDLAFKQAIDGQYAVDLDEEAKSALFYVWQDDINGYALDAAMVNKADYETWQGIKKALCSLSTTIQKKFDEADAGLYTVELHLVDPYDFELLLASISDGAVTFDIVDETPAGQKVSTALYGEDAYHAREPRTLGEQNALKTALSYLSVSAFSKTGLISQLEFEGYTHSEAVFAAESCGADWDEQAAKSAASYLRISSFSRQGLIEQLQFEGFTYEQALYGVVKNGY